MGAAHPGSPPSALPRCLITYVYDGLQRLTDAVENLGTIYYYTYDAAGNRTDVLLNGVVHTHHEFDAANQVLG